MVRRIKLIFWIGGKTGGVNCLEKSIEYHGRSEKEIEKKIAQDKKAIQEYMHKGFVKGDDCFTFGDFMIKKRGIVAVEFAEADY